MKDSKGVSGSLLQADNTTGKLRLVFFSTFNYAEIPFGPDRPVRLKRQRGVDQIANRPHPAESSDDRFTYEKKIIERFGGQHELDLIVPPPPASALPPPSTTTH